MDTQELYRSARRKIENCEPITAEENDAYLLHCPADQVGADFDADKYSHGLDYCLRHAREFHTTTGCDQCESEAIAAMLAARATYRRRNRNIVAGENAPVSHAERVKLSEDLAAMETSPEHRISSGTATGSEDRGNLPAVTPHVGPIGPVDYRAELARAMREEVDADEHYTRYEGKRDALTLAIIATVFLLSGAAVCGMGWLLVRTIIGAIAR